MKPSRWSNEVEMGNSYRPQPIEPIGRLRPWMVPVALAALIVVLLIALIGMAAQAPGANDIEAPPVVKETP